MPWTPLERPFWIPAALALGGLLWGCSGAPGDRLERPNVVLISLDTLRADHLHAYGYERATSPRIDELAAGGVLFERTVAPTSWTLPSHLSLLTGLAISAHGICDDRLWQVVGTEGGPGELPLRGTFLPEVLRAHGYATAGFYTWKYLEPRFGFGPGFDVYERVGHSVFSHPDWSRRFEELRAAGKLDEIEAWRDQNPAIFDEARPTADEAVDRALSWVNGRAKDGQPFFLFLHLFDAHDSYVPPPPFDTRFVDPDYAGAIDGRRVTTPDSPVRADMDPRDLEQLIALYDGEIAWVDSQVGRVLDRLDALGLREDTLVVLTSDHGEEFFEHGGKTHRAQLYTESVHVPLVLSWPGVLPAGRRVGGTTGLVDVAPTIYGLAGVPAPRCASGRDLAAIARGDAENEPVDYTTELVVFEPGSSAPRRHTGLYFEQSLALLHQVPGQTAWIETFDLAANASGSGPGRRARGGPDLLERLARARERLRADRACSPLRGIDTRPLTKTEIRELQAMGYAGTSDGAKASASARLCLDGCVWPD